LEAVKDAIVPTELEDVETITQRMAQIRQKHHEGFRNVLAGAEEAVELDGYLGALKWATAGAAGVIAFWMLTRLRRMARAGRTTRVEFAQTDRGVAEGLVRETAVLSASERFARNIWKFFMPALVRATQNYAAHWLERWITSKRIGTAGRGALPHGGYADGRNGASARLEFEPDSQRTRILKVESRGPHDSRSEGSSDG
jgi:hypothetical protein